MRFNYFNKEYFDENGFVIINPNLSLQDIQKARESFEKVYKKTKNFEYEFFRVYDDYIGFPNISGIEMPLHKDIIDDGIINFLNKSNIPSISSELLGNNLKITLSRYHITRNYSHIGIWHRDGKYNENNSIQFQYYLYDETGIEVISKSHKRDFYDNEKRQLKKSLYSKLDNSVHVSVLAGDLLVFDPSIIHRGISKNDRVNIHFRIVRDQNFTFLESDYNNKFNKDWKRILNNKNSIIEDNKIQKYNEKNTLKRKVFRVIRTMLHYSLFFIPFHSDLCKKFRFMPSLRIGIPAKNNKDL